MMGGWRVEGGFQAWVSPLCGSLPPLTSVSLSPRPEETERGKAVWVKPRRRGRHRKQATGVAVRRMLNPIGEVIITPANLARGASTPQCRRVKRTLSHGSPELVPVVVCRCISVYCKPRAVSAVLQRLLRASTRKRWDATLRRGDGVTDTSSYWGFL
ncbi:hypothetical protein CGRA01v4_11571 [Colletotrichum graminicola]|nr:hypothetical protein CGRA01v4_11571 [Colletotrichum graminicola]